MKPETLEALLIDRALGHLSSDTEELLAEYLVVKPESARLAEEWSGTVSLAAKALQATAPRLVVPPRKPAGVSYRWMPRVLALAASFLVGVAFALLGLQGVVSQGSSRLSSTDMPLTEPPPALSTPLAPSEARIRTMPFWSTERAVALAATRQPIPTNR